MTDVDLPTTQAENSTGEGTPIERFKRFVGEGSLYATRAFSSEEFQEIARSFAEVGLSIDLHCPDCNDPSTFLRPPPGPSLELRAVDQLVQTVQALELRCARNKDHRIEFVIRMTQKLMGWRPVRKAGGDIQEPLYERRFVKIGQFPPHAELVAGRLKAVSKIADKIDTFELRRAAGLISHDSAIGAFVYLRRVFERIIAKAWQSAIAAGETLPDPTGLRMTEKIAALKNHLPGIVVQNAKVYGILSKGLHELTEEDCARAYPLVEESVIWMLEDALARFERLKRERTITAELAKLSGELGNNSKADSD